MTAFPGRTAAESATQRCVDLDQRCDRAIGTRDEVESIGGSRRAASGSRKTGAAMNEEVVAILDQGRLLLVQHAPEVLRGAIPAGIVCLLLGIGLSVLGAKLSRFALTSVWVGLGAIAGGEFAALTEFPKILCVLGGGAIFGVLGYHSYRLWAGVLAGAVLSAIALGVFGYRNVAPHVGDYQRQSVAAVVEPSTTFTIPSPQEQRSYLDRSPRDWFAQLHAYIERVDPQADRNGQALGFAVLAIGACIGVMAVRWATILSTSLVGTALVTAGFAALLSRIDPERSYQAVQNHGNVFVFGVGGFLLTSLVLQTLLTRTRSCPHAERAEK